VVVYLFLDVEGLIVMVYCGFLLIGLENIMMVFVVVVELGVIYVEIDVYVMRDGVVVVFYDSVLDCVSDGCGVIVDFIWVDLCLVWVGGVEVVLMLVELLLIWL